MPLSSIDAAEARSCMTIDGLGGTLGCITPSSSDAEAGADIPSFVNQPMAVDPPLHDDGSSDSDADSSASLVEFPGDASAATAAAASYIVQRLAAAQPHLITDQPTFARSSIGMSALARLIQSVPAMLAANGTNSTCAQADVQLVCCCASIAVTPALHASSAASLQATLDCAKAWYDSTPAQVQLLGSSVSNGSYPRALILTEGLRHGVLQALIQQLTRARWPGSVLVIGICRNDENLLCASTALCALAAVCGPFCTKGCTAVALSHEQWQLDISEDSASFPASCKLVVCSLEPLLWASQSPDFAAQPARVFGPSAGASFFMQAAETLRSKAIKDLCRAQSCQQLPDFIWKCQRSPAQLGELQLVNFICHFTAQPTRAQLDKVRKWFNKNISCYDGHLAIIFASDLQLDDPVCALTLTNSVLEEMINVNGSHKETAASHTVALQMGICLATKSAAETWARAELQYIVLPRQQPMATSAGSISPAVSAGPLTILCGAAKPLRQTTTHWVGCSTALFRLPLITMPQAFQVDGPQILPLDEWDECLQAIAGRQPQCAYATGTILGNQADSIILFWVDPTQVRQLLGLMKFGKAVLQVFLAGRETSLIIREYYGPATPKEAEPVLATTAWQGPLFNATARLGADCPVSCTLPVRVWVQGTCHTFSEPKPAITSLTVPLSDITSDHMLPWRSGVGASVSHGITLDKRRTYNIPFFAWCLSINIGKQHSNNREAALQAAVVIFGCLPAQWGDSSTSNAPVFQHSAPSADASGDLGSRPGELLHCKAIILIHDSPDGAGFAVYKKATHVGDILCQSNGLSALVVRPADLGLCSLRYAAPAANTGTAAHVILVQEPLAGTDPTHREHERKQPSHEGAKVPGADPTPDAPEPLRPGRPQEAFQLFEKLPNSAPCSVLPAPLEQLAILLHIQRRHFLEGFCKGWEWMCSFGSTHANGASPQALWNLAISVTVMWLAECAGVHEDSALLTEWAAVMPCDPRKGVWQAWAAKRTPLHSQTPEPACLDGLPWNLEPWTGSTITSSTTAPDICFTTAVQLLLGTQAAGPANTNGAQGPASASGVTAAQPATAGAGPSGVPTAAPPTASTGAAQLSLTPATGLLHLSFCDDMGACRIAMASVLAATRVTPATHVAVAIHEDPTAADMAKAIHDAGGDALAGPEPIFLYGYWALLRYQAHTLSAHLKLLPQRALVVITVAPTITMHMGDAQQGMRLGIMHPDYSAVWAAAVTRQVIRALRPDVAIWPLLVLPEPIPQAHISVLCKLFDLTEDPRQLQPHPSAPLALIRHAAILGGPSMAHTSIEVLPAASVSFNAHPLPGSLAQPSPGGLLLWGGSECPIGLAPRNDGLASVLDFQGIVIDTTNGGPAPQWQAAMPPEVQASAAALELGRSRHTMNAWTAHHRTVHTWLKLHGATVGVRSPTRADVTDILGIPWAVTALPSCTDEFACYTFRRLLCVRTAAAALLPAAQILLGKAREQAPHIPIQELEASMMSLRLMLSSDPESAKIATLRLLPLRSAAGAR